MQETYLLTNATSNGDGSEVRISPPQQLGGFINRTVYMYGTIDGATITLYAGDKAGGTYTLISDATVTALPSVQNLSIRADYLKANVASAGASTDVTVVIV